MTERGRTLRPEFREKFKIRKVGESVIRSGFAELIESVGSGGDGDRPGADGTAATNIRRGIADDPESVGMKAVIGAVPHFAESGPGDIIAVGMMVAEAAE